jgi:hypothetical protein
MGDARVPVYVFISPGRAANEAGDENVGAYSRGTPVAGRRQPPTAGEHEEGPHRVAAGESLSGADRCAPHGVDSRIIEVEVGHSGGRSAQMRPETLSVRCSR